eukprot:TRINITY_DN31072_c0_g1_i2.p1 TRINITY_DN31072_c0_g1~~TRINITY_DN31072_c0_g1_i2.p1  ORF type:complete len:272 (+),score=10.14 TRINITY_DN31072_c0_g1_i2:304-1119(+)
MWAFDVLWLLSSCIDACRPDHGGAKALECSIDTCKGIWSVVFIATSAPLIFVFGLGLWQYEGVRSEINLAAWSAGTCQVLATGVLGQVASGCHCAIEGVPTDVSCEAFADAFGGTRHTAWRPDWPWGSEGPPCEASPGRCPKSECLYWSWALVRKRSGSVACAYSLGNGNAMWASNAWEDACYSRRGLLSRNTSSAAALCYVEETSGAVAFDPAFPHIIHARTSLAADLLYSAVLAGAIVALGSCWSCRTTTAQTVQTPSACQERLLVAKT